MPIRYDVVTGSTAIDLAAKVEKLMMKQWELQGGVAVASSVISGVPVNVYAQAMTLPKKPPY